MDIGGSYGALGGPTIAIRELTKDSINFILSDTDLRYTLDRRRKEIRMQTVTKD